MRQVSVFGLGYVGCVTAACLGRDGHRVVGVDVDDEKISAVNSGMVPVSEPGLDELLAAQVATGRLRATADVESAVRESDLALIAVGTPSSADGSVATRAVEGVIASIGRALRGASRPYTIVVRSTLLPGILEDRLTPLLEESSGATLGTSLALCNNPEFLREATAIRDYDDPPFVLVGATDEAQAAPVLDLYRGVKAERIVTDTRTASLVKYACNSFHALKIAFANEIGAVAGAFGADGQDVMKIVCRDRRLNISPAYLRPGFSFGGSCLPKDVRALTRFAEREALRVDLLDAILPSNESHLARAVKLIQEGGRKRVGLIGLSFKANTDDLRESPQVILAETLLGRGFDLKIYDPGVAVSRLRGRNLAYVDQHLPHLAALLVEDPTELLSHAEMLILATDVANGFDWHSAFRGETLDLRRDLVAARPPAAALA